MFIECQNIFPTSLSICFPLQASVFLLSFIAYILGISRLLNKWIKKLERKRRTCKWEKEKETGLRSSGRQLKVWIFPLYSLYQQCQIEEVPRMGLWKEKGEDKVILWLMGHTERTWVPSPVWICNESEDISLLSVNFLSPSEYKVGLWGHKSDLWDLMNGYCANPAFALDLET